MIPYTSMKNNFTSPTHNIRVENNINVNDIVYLKINNKNKPIFCKIGKINDKSISVNELILIYENDKIHFYIDKNSTNIINYNCCFNLDRCIYKCDDNEYDLI